ncbi:MAG TPA: alpha/beta fold hydrolase, partial [Gemmatimonadaceae bacterium]|nr:alpha/beta fold hydrolase [Gemmatimonadaceae bacterium]
MRRTTLIAVLFVAAILVSLAAFVRLFEPRFAFFPSTGESVTPRDYGVDYQPLTVETRDGQKLRGWRLRGPEVRARILYFHGNGGNLSVWAPIVTGIARRGFSVFAFDYRGYGLSTGRPTEQGLYRDVDAIIDQFWASPADDGAPVVYWGRSLGVAMATYAATIRKPDGVILEA